MRTRRGSLLHRVLTRTIATTTNRDRAEHSRFTWGYADGTDVRNRFPGIVRPPKPQVYRLTLLGVLNGLFHVTLYIEDRT